MEKSDYTIILFYKFTRLKNPEKVRDQQKNIAESFHLKGRMFVANEGINATFEGLTKDIKAYQKKCKSTRLFSGVIFKESQGTGNAFTKLIVRVRPEVVTLGAGEFNIKKETAKAITAKQLEKMYSKKEDFVVLDLRNDYEIDAGYFEKTVNPHLKNFRELPEKLSQLENLKNKKVVAVCTGGIRCEKATCLLQREGFEKIYQLKDGIHTYMKQYPGRHFKGSLFVFDNRMVSPIVEDASRDIVGRCKFCKKPCEAFYSDDSVRPSQKIICCGKCLPAHRKTLRNCIPA